MKTKYTPGPWIMDDSDGDQLLIGDSLLIAEVYNDETQKRTEGFVPDAEGKANYLLVSKSPELFEAFFELRKAFFEDGTPKALRAAFAKYHPLAEQLKEIR